MVSWILQNSPPFDRSICFYVAITGNFGCFQYYNFEINFLKNENLFQKIGVQFLVKGPKIENVYFHKKLPCQKSKLRQIEWGVKN